MSVSILEALENVSYNLENNGSFGIMLAVNQLNNAIALLDKGYGPHEQVEPLLEKYGDVESVPDKVEES